MKRSTAFVLTALLSMSSCVDPVTGPGDEVMGNFEFTAALMVAAPDAGQEPIPPCEYREFSEAFSFSARFARFRDTGNAFITIGGYPRDAGFDGQVLSGSNSPNRPHARVYTPIAADCTCQTAVIETLTVALLSSSQNTAVGDSCPDNPLDGGVPAATEDGGIRLPDTTPSGFDAVRACGELEERVVSDGGTRFGPDGSVECACAEVCTMRYAVKGARR